MFLLMSWVQGPLEAQKEAVVIDLAGGVDDSERVAPAGAPGLLPASSNPRSFVRTDSSTLFVFNPVGGGWAIGEFEDGLVRTLQTGVRESSVPVATTAGLYYLSTTFEVVGPTVSVPQISTLVLGIEHQGEVFMGVATGSFDGLLVTDGTELGTRFVGWGSCVLGAPCPPFYFGPSFMRPLGEVLLFDRLSTQSCASLISEPRCGGLFALPPGAEVPMQLTEADEIGNMVAAGDYVYFSEKNGNAWTVAASNGTELGSRTVAGQEHRTEPRLVVLEDTAYFFHPLSGGGNSMSLWRANDGRASVAIRNVAEGAASVEVLGAVAAETRIFYRARQSGGPSGLWTTDGRETRFVTRTGGGPAIDPLSDESSRLGYARTATAVGDRIVFSGFDNAAGREPWVSDGTVRGTFRIADINPGNASSDPLDFTWSGDHVLMSAATPQGRELVVISVDDLFADPILTIAAPAVAETGETVVFALDSSDAVDSYCWRFGDEESGDLGCSAISPLPGHVYDEPGNYTVSVSVGRRLPSGSRQVFETSTQLLVEAAPEPDPPCVECLRDGRFVVSVDWVDPTGRTGAGKPITYSQDTLMFWFFDPGNVELAVKVLDGRDVNDHHWVIYGALSDVQYTVSVLDTETGLVAEYENPAGNLCGVIDVEALPQPIPPPSGVVGSGSVPSGGTSPDACGGDAVCLQDDRFRVQARFRTDIDEPWRPAQPISSNGDTGMFWFFESGNVELLVKILDGTAVNDHFWLYFGELTDVEYELTVTDTVTGVAHVLANEAGEICGGGVIDLLSSG